MPEYYVKGLTIKFTDEEAAHLEELAERYDVSKSAVMRWAVDALRAYVEANDDNLILPIRIDPNCVPKKDGKHLPKLTPHRVNLRRETSSSLSSETGP